MMLIRVMLFMLGAVFCVAGGITVDVSAVVAATALAIGFALLGASILGDFKELPDLDEWENIER